MKLQPDLLKVVLDYIESKAKVNSNNFDIVYNISIKEIIDVYSQRIYKPEDVEYVIALLKQFEYIDIKDGNIIKLTTNGNKFLLSLRYNINCNY